LPLRKRDFFPSPLVGLLRNLRIVIP